MAMADESGVATCVLIDRGGERFLGVTRKDNHFDWGLPGGKLEGSETPAECAVRELFEETGIRTEPKELEEIFRAPARTPGRVSICYRPLSWTGIPDSKEGARVDWVGWDELVAGSFREYNTKLRARMHLVPECAACLETSDPRFYWRGHHLCDGCFPHKEKDDTKESVAWYAKHLLEHIEKKKKLDPKSKVAVWYGGKCPTPEGIPYWTMGPPRRTHGWDEYDREVSRQKKLVDFGLLRRGKSTMGMGATLGWQRFSDGYFGWSGWNDGIPGGTWPSPDDFEKAWEAGRHERFGDLFEDFLR